MKSDDPFGDLPQSFRDEQEVLLEAGISNWIDLNALNEQDLKNLASHGRSTIRNLKRLKGIADLICQLEIEPKHAALLLHSGLGTISALASSTPQAIIQQTGRLERQLKVFDSSVVDLSKAHRWIEKAKKARQLRN